MTKGAGKEEVTIDELLQNLQSLVTDAEGLLSATASQAGEKVQEARTKAEESLSAARERLAEVQDGALQQARQLLNEGNAYVQRNPWQAVGIAAGIGLVVGLLLGRRQS